MSLLNKLAKPAPWQQGAGHKQKTRQAGEPWGKGTLLLRLHPGSEGACRLRAAGAWRLEPVSQPGIFYSPALPHRSPELPHSDHFSKSFHCL